MHFDTPNPEIDFDALKLQVATDQPWPIAENGRRLAGINSFGYGGTNAHAILEGSDATDSDVEVTTGTDERSDRVEAFPISARSPEALRETAQVLAEFAKENATTVTLPDLAASLSARRSHHEHRAVFSAAARPELVQQLAAFGASGESEAVVGRATLEPSSPIAHH